MVNHSVRRRFTLDKCVLIDGALVSTNEYRVSDCNLNSLNLRYPVTVDGHDWPVDIYVRSWRVRDADGEKRISFAVSGELRLTSPGSPGCNYVLLVDDGVPVDNVVVDVHGLDVTKLTARVLSVCRQVMACAVGL